MKSVLAALAIINLLTNNCFGVKNSFDKSCFIQYLIKNNQLDGEKFKNFNQNKPLESECETAVNSTLEALKTSSQDKCVVEFLNKKDVAEVLLRQYLKPQMDNNLNQVTFDDQFTEFRWKTVNITSIICKNKSIFRPNVAELMRGAKQHKESKAKELKCIELYIKKPNQKLSDECQKVINYVKNDFYQQIEYDVKTAFASPYDNLINFECGREKADQFKLFERVFFFVVLATSRDLSDKQINTVAKNTDNAISSSQKVIFECINF